MHIDLESQLMGSYAVYGMLQILKDVCVDILDFADPTHAHTALYLVVGLFYCSGASPALPLALFMFRSLAMLSGLDFLSQILDLQKLRNLFEGLFLLLVAVMATETLIRVGQASPELELLLDQAKQFGIHL